MDKVTGMRPGCEHAGQPLRPMREAETSTRVVPFDKLRTSLGCPVESRLGFEPESVCITHSPKIHAPAFKPKESVA
jgi:hypothetical protein